MSRGPTYLTVPLFLTFAIPTWITVWFPGTSDLPIGFGLARVAAAESTSNGQPAISGVIHEDDADFAREHGDVFGLVPILERAAKANDAKALYELGLIYKVGSEPYTTYYGIVTSMKIDANPDKSIGYFRRAADLDHIEAMYQLAVMYLKASGRKRDVALSMRYYNQAAERGEVHAQNDLGNFLIEGNYVETNIPLGIEWIRKSASAGYPLAELNLALIYERGESVPVDYQIALRWALLGSRWFPGADEKMIDEGKKVVDRLKEQVSDEEFRHANEEARRMESDLLSGKSIDK